MKVEMKKRYIPFFWVTNYNDVISGVIEFSIMLIKTWKID